jgi:hypothetical protein
MFYPEVHIHLLISSGSYTSILWMKMICIETAKTLRVMYVIQLRKLNLSFLRQLKTEQTVAQGETARLCSLFCISDLGVYVYISFILVCYRPKLIHSLAVLQPFVGPCHLF